MATPETAAPDPAALGASMSQTMPPVTGAAAPAASAASSIPPAPEATPIPGVTRDGRGVPFDPAKHLKLSRKSGLWVPKSPGRFGVGGAKRPPPPSSPPQPAKSAQGTEADLFSSSSVPPPSPASGSGSTSPGGGASYIPPESDLPPPPADKSAAGAGAAKPQADPADAEPVAGADDVAEVACDLLAEGLGILTGAPEEAEPTAREGLRLRKVLGAYLDSKGIKTRGLGAVLLAFGAWMLRTVKKPKTREWARAQFRPKARPEKRVSPDPEPATTATPEPAPAAADASPAPARPVPYVLSLPRR